MTPDPTRDERPRMTTNTPSSPTRCRDCALYDLQAVLSKNGRVVKGRAARCLWKSTEVWPLSVWGQSRPTARYMEPNDGAGCECFAALTPKGDCDV